MNGKVKKFVAAVMAVMCIGAAVALAGCSLFYDLDEGEYFAIGYKKNNAFVSWCFWYGGETVIEVPDDYNGIPITELGGYMGRGYPCPFAVSLRDREYDWTSDAEWVEIYGVGENVQTLEFKVKLGKNIKKITYVNTAEYYGIEWIEYGDDNNPVYEVLVRVVYRFYVDEENSAFYSDNGRLYYRSNNALVDEFIYE